MIGVPVNPNSVYVPMLQTGCLKAEFDSTYSVHLNGIISQDEFRESISKINRAISSNKILIIITTLFGLIIISGMILFIIGGLTAANSRTYGFPVLVGVGIGVTSFGILFVTIGCYIIQSRRAERMRQVISEESMKYSSRSPTPCSWRLDISRTSVGGYERQHNTQLVYHLVIDIGRFVGPGSETRVHYSNRVAPESISFYKQQDSYPPPPYSGQSTAFCSQCGVTRQDLTAKFCSSCGQLFNQY